MEPLIAAYDQVEEHLAAAVVAVNALAESVAELGREIARIDPATDPFDREKIERRYPIHPS